ncbi:MAG: GntR family transcriptional regulator [Synergistaceae bacterium]|nr:GntR family transcriptional regulator [Synergistaceae bacterium]
MLKLQKLYKSETALEILQEAILSGDVPSGLELTQTETALSLGVSRMPVREALAALEYCGLVERLPGQHMRVSILDDEIIKSVFQDMALLATEAIKNFNHETRRALSEFENQNAFHNFLVENIKSPLRKKFLVIVTEIYLPFVLKNSQGCTEINDAFKNLRLALEDESENLKASFENYGSILAEALIKIRREKKIKNVECQTREIIACP